MIRTLSRGSKNRPQGLALALAFLLYAVPSAGQSGSSANGIRITDPAELAGLGFGADAIVYRAPEAGKPQPLPAGSEAESPEEFGPGAGYSAYEGDQFHGRISTYAYGCFFCTGDVFHTGGDPFASVQVEMPGGATFSAVRWWGHDNHAQDLQLVVARTCLPAFAPGPPVNTLIGAGNSAGTPGDTTGVMTIFSPETVDNETCTYWVRVVWNAVGNTLRLYKVRAQWEREVSPPPAVATFGDVPTTHPFFQFVEALSASGITAGCNVAPPLYCPDAALTRGQMAVFLSKALGLQWP